MSDYRMGALNPAFPHVKRVVAWFVFIDPEYDATFVFSASERGASIFRPSESGE